MSAKYLLQDKKVISLNHTNFSYSIFEKNISTDSEYSLCTKYYDYKTNIKKQNYFIKKLKLPIFKNETRYFIKKYKINEKQNFLYLPKKFHGHKRYFGGIYNQIDDLDYHKFQNKILSFSDRIFLKQHPKNIINFKYKIRSERIIYEKFNKIKNSNYDLFIIDSITQPFFDIAKSNSKILFFLIAWVKSLNQSFIKCLATDCILQE